MALAGFAVAFSLCGVLYSPLLVGQQVAATRLLAGDRFGPIQSFWLRIGALLSLVTLAVGLLAAGATGSSAPSWGCLATSSDEARTAIILLAPVPLLTATRAVHQGRLVAGHHTNPIALATARPHRRSRAVRCRVDGVDLGGCLGGRRRVHPRPAGRDGTGRRRPGRGRTDRCNAVAPEGAAPRVADTRLLRFSTPLMANTLLWWSTPLLINSVLARSPFPAEAIAAFIVVEGVAWFLTAPVGQFQHVGIALVDCKPAHRAVRRWLVILAAGVAMLVGVVSLPPIRQVVLGAVFDLDAGLLSDIGAALPFAVAYPLLYGHRQYYQGLFMRSGQSDAVGWGAALRVATVLGVAVAGLGPLGQSGATLGVLSAVAGLTLEGLFLERVARRQVITTLPDSGPPHREVLAGEGVT